MEIPKGLHKFRATDREECGLIIKAPDNSTYVVRVKNYSKRNNGYVIRLSDVQKVQAVLVDDEEVIGFFHTHLPHHTADPSDDDLDGAELFPGLNNLIYKPDTGETQWYGVVEEVAPAT